VRRAFRVAYDGRPYHGFQRQPSVPTVEDHLFRALESLGVADDVPETYSAAGRTDRGVSALAQTVAFDCPGWLTPRALAPELPDRIWPWAHADVDQGFHATRDASERTYEYHLFAPAADAARASAAADLLSGRHDVANLTADDEHTVRDVAVSVVRDGDHLVLTVTAGGFPRAFVRRVASLVGAVAAGAADLSRVERILDPEPVPGPQGVRAAPPSPLVLTAVAYDVAFTVDERAAADARAAFGGRAALHATDARVAGRIRDGMGAF